MLYLTETQWNSRMKTIATKRLHKFRKVLTATSMALYFNDAVIEIQTSSTQEAVFVVDEKKYKDIRTLFMNHSDDDLKKRGVF